LEKLKKWGIIVLPTEKGYLACGDFGYGKLLDPDLIYLHLLREMKKGNSKKRILITSGATIEKIDQIRSVSNISTGKTAIAIADVLYENGFDVRLLSCANSAKSNYSIPNYSFSSANDLKNEISSILKKDNYNLVIHLAAVSDYSPKTIKIGEKEANLPFDGKLDSSIDEFSIKFERNEKIVNQIKGMAKNKIKLVSFKFLDKQNSKRKSSEIEKLLNEGNSDFVVFNSLDNRKNNTQFGFQIFSKTHQFEIVENATELANQIITIIEKKL
jgi:phosphopantothenoylcysteine decarboxylase/phosphopantothenate--cysteine ligase